MKYKPKQQIIYDFIQVFPLNHENEEKRIWVMVYLYSKGRLLSEGRAACCVADIKAGLYSQEHGIEIATGRARIAVEKKRSYGKLPGDYYKGAYYGPGMDPSPTPFLGMALAGMAMAEHMNHPKSCPRCGAMLRPPLSSLVTSNLPEVPLTKMKARSRKVLKLAVRTCAHP